MAQKNKSKRKNLKIRLYYIIHDCGDGSARVSFFTNRELAEKVYEKDAENCEALHDGCGIKEEEFELDSKTGQIVSGVVTSMNEFLGEE